MIQAFNLIFVELFINFALEIETDHRMNLHKIFFTLLISISATLGINAQNHSAREAHRAAHRAQLANVNSKMDKSVLNDFIKNDVERRETSSLINDLSAESSQLIADLLKESNRHIGKRYVHGSKGPNTFDCSGFTSYVYKQFGFKISPASRMQYTEGVPVKRNDLRKGDLVFFTSRSSGRNVGHVGIVVSADNASGAFKFIHASISGVKISDFAGYYVPRYVGARRIITE